MLGTRDGAGGETDIAITSVGFVFCWGVRI